MANNLQSSTKMIQDLSTVPEIIGALGLSIAAAQKALDLNYLESMERIIQISRRLKKGKKSGKTATDNILEHIVLSLAPSRYQFTETTLAVRLDLAQTFSDSIAVGLGVNIGTVAITASMTSAYGYDYQAAAEVKTVLHAIPADANVLKTLLARSKEVNDNEIETPERSEVDNELLATAERIYKQLGDADSSTNELDSADGT